MSVVSLELDAEMEGKEEADDAIGESTLDTDVLLTTETPAISPDDDDDDDDVCSCRLCSVHCGTLLS